MRFRTTGWVVSATSVLWLLLASWFVPAADAATVGEILAPPSGRVNFVSPPSDNGADGSKERPLKNIDKAMKVATSGDTIAVAEGTYSGTFSIGFLETDKAFHLYGGFSSDFSQRDPVKHPTAFQPDNASAK